MKKKNDPTPKIFLPKFARIVQIRKKDLLVIAGSFNRIEGAAYIIRQGGERLKAKWFGFVGPNGPSHKRFVAGRAIDLPAKVVKQITKGEIDYV